MAGQEQMGRGANSLIKESMSASRRLRAPVCALMKPSRFGCSYSWEGARGGFPKTILIRGLSLLRVTVITPLPPSLLPLSLCCSLNGRKQREEEDSSPPPLLSAPPLLSRMSSFLLSSFFSFGSISLFYIPHWFFYSPPLFLQIKFRYLVWKFLFFQNKSISGLRATPILWVRGFLPSLLLRFFLFLQFYFYFESFLFYQIKSISL